MSYFDMYKSRLNATGINSANSIVNSTKQTINNNFDISPFAISVLIDDIEFRVILTHDSKSKNKKLLLKPENRINIGSSVHVGDDFYLVMDFLGEGVYEIYPTATLQQCNSFFPAITDKTRVLIGRDDDGRPVYEEVEQKVNVPCIVEPSISINTDKVDQLLLPKGSIKISLKYAKYMNINSNDKFEMYGNRYEIEDIDYSKVINEIGIMVIYAKKDVKES